jgi:UDP-N-acetylglucosamine 2-epimerase (non-hydrolysing)
MNTFIVVAGTRPEIIKVAPIIRNILKSKLELYFVHTGQHHDYSLASQMIRDLNLPPPDLSFELEKLSPASQIAEIMTKLEEPLKKTKENVVVVQGDTNSVLSAALAAVKVEAPLAHVEAGLRSHDWRMPEEHNRRMVDHISNVLFAPTYDSKRNLLNEHVYGKVHVTGNTVVDAVRQHLPIAVVRSKVLDNLRFSDYILVTLHRAENVDDPEVLGNVVHSLIKSDIPIVLPLHPRTRERLKNFGYFDRLMNKKNISILPPQGYLDFLVLLKNCRFVVTDSGGIQEESTSPLICRRVLVLRRSSERTEALRSGAAKLVNPNSGEIDREILIEWNTTPRRISNSPYGDGYTSEKILRILINSLPELIARRHW